MNYLSPEIAKHAKRTNAASKKSLAKPGVSCGIFQDCLDTNVKYTERFKEFNKKKNG